MRQIELHGRHAVGEHRYALVDDDLFDKLNAYHWKAKPNGSGSNVYAVRNHIADDGRCITIRMHRVVLGYDGPLDIDHWNHNSLDNQLLNLRVATRSENLLNGMPTVVSRVCDHCGVAKDRLTVRRAASFVRYCSVTCLQAKIRADRVSKEAYFPPPPRPPLPLHTMRCAHCSGEHTTHDKRQNYCGAQCKSAAKWQRMVANDHPYVLANAAKAKAWRERQRAAGGSQIEARKAKAKARRHDRKSMSGVMALLSLLSGSSDGPLHHG